HGPSRGYCLGALTTSRLRPFARRRLRTLRPALVALRLRNPCARLRRTLLGWYVRFTTAASWSRNTGGAEKARQSITLPRHCQREERKSIHREAPTPT